MPGWSRSRLWSALRMQRTYRFCKGIHGRYVFFCMLKSLAV